MILLSVARQDDLVEAVRNGWHAIRPLTSVLAEWLATTYPASERAPGHDGEPRPGPHNQHGPSRSGSGHEDLLPPSRLSARDRLGEGTFAGANDNGRDAPMPAVRALMIGRRKSTLKRYSRPSSAGRRDDQKAAVRAGLSPIEPNIAATTRSRCRSSPCGRLICGSSAAIASSVSASSSALASLRSGKGASPTFCRRSGGISCLVMPALGPIRWVGRRARGFARQSGAQPGVRPEIGHVRAGRWPHRGKRRRLIFEFSGFGRNCIARTISFVSF